MNTVQLTGTNNEAQPITLSDNGDTVYYSVYNDEYDSEDNYVGTTSSIVAFDTATGTAHVPATVDGIVKEIVEHDDRLIVRTEQGYFDPQNYTTIYTSRIAVIDTDTGAILGTPVEMKALRRTMGKRQSS